MGRGDVPHRTPGGSDVGANTTRAVQDGDEWLLSGEKHFCSNVDAEVFIVLARPEGAPAGSRGLATYIVPRILPDGSANGFTIKRLKPKLGTVGVPTGEVSLDGARAWLAGGTGALEGGVGSGVADAARDGRGINRMMEMVNGSRFGVALMGLGIHRRSFLEAAIYAARREQFGNRIDSYPLVRETLVDMLVDLEAGMAATYECAAAARGAHDAEAGRLVRRILVPLAKMRCTRMALWAASTGLEVLGGNGYMEDWPMARQLRDAQCHTIWEGTENILCIDVRRAMRGEQAHIALLAPRRTGTRDGLGAQGPRRRPRHRGGVAGRHPRWRSRIWRAPPTTWPCCRAGGSPSSSPTPWRAPCSSRKRRGPSTASGDARKAAVARRFVSRRLATPALRGITDPDRSVLDLFEPLVRYGSIDESDLAACNRLRTGGRARPAAQGRAVEGVGAPRRRRPRPR